MTHTSIRQIKFLDTTLRDGEQSPGAGMDVTEKLSIARELLRLRVDVIEAGFPASSPGDFDSVRQVAALVGDQAVVCALARAVARDIEAAAAALEGAARGRIHTGLGLSSVHLLYKLQMSREDALDSAVQAVKLARHYCDDVQFYAEDAGRTERAYLQQVLEAVIASGASTINVPDTTGALLPDQYGELISFLLHNVRGIEGVTLSAHCHNDLGLATAASLSAIAAGAGQVECTVNGIGERAGNAALEEIAVALALHGSHLGACCAIELSELTRASRLVASITGTAVSANKAVVGANAFAHSSGIHQDGVLKQRSTYEIIDPQSVGASQSSLVLSARSGRAALRHRLEQLGYVLDDGALDQLNTRFLQIADKKSLVYDEDLEALMAEYGRGIESVWSLKILQVSCGSPLIATATVVLNNADGREFITCASGAGPIDATFKAINTLVFASDDSPEKDGRILATTSSCADAALEPGRPCGRHCDLQRFAVQAITRGSDALGEVSVQLADAQGQVFSGRGADGDIIVSSAKAYLNALNRLLRAAAACA
ncbi:MAG: 2-isopropylmalate synthase [Coriobacteriales bacterium]|jgi:2-isopropylmalate synthase|nr:2-isopropylmalate synthase [Coriobacteriales bacterium]